MCRYVERSVHTHTHTHTHTTTTTTTRCCCHPYHCSFFFLFSFPFFLFFHSLTFCLLAYLLTTLSFSPVFIICFYSVLELVCLFVCFPSSILILCCNRPASFSPATLTLLYYTFSRLQFNLPCEVCAKFGTYMRTARPTGGTLQ